MEYTDEEKKAINFFKKYNWYADINEEHENIDILFNLIEKQQEEIEKKDKIIYKMAKQIENYDNQLNISYFKNIEDIKNFFEKEVGE